MMLLLFQGPDSSTAITQINFTIRIRTRTTPLSLLSQRTAGGGGAWFRKQEVRSLSHSHSVGSSQGPPSFSLAVPCAHHTLRHAKPREALSLKGRVTCRHVYGVPGEGQWLFSAWR